MQANIAFTVSAIIIETLLVRQESVTHGTNFVSSCLQKTFPCFQSRRDDSLDCLAFKNNV